MYKKHPNQPIYNPPFYLHKINNYEKAVYQRKGHWTQKQKVKYGVFLEIFREKFEDRENPILNKMFRVMSDFMKTRNHNQCRSHHQKMEKERFQIDSILESISSKYHPREYQLFFQKYSRHIKALDIETVLNQKGFTPHKNVERRRRRTRSSIVKTQLKQDLIMAKPKGNLQTEQVKIKKINNKMEELIFFKEKDNPLQIQKNNQQQNQKQKVPQNNTKQINLNPTANKSPPLQIKNIDQKEQKPLKKTGLQYDSDYENNDEEPKAAIVEIPKDDFLNVKVDSVEKIKVNMVSQYPQDMSHMTNHLPISTYGVYHNYGQSFPICTNSMNLNEGYGMRIDELQDRKKWHLSEAARLCNDMNEHIKRAKMYQDMKDAMVEQMIGMSRGYYFGGHFASSQF